MKIKTADLIGRPLDWAVTVALGCAREGVAWRLPDGTLQVGTSPYSTSGSDVIDIMERELLSVGCSGGEFWAAIPEGPDYFGPTLRIAVCRCLCASKLGSEVEVPDELVKEN